MTLLSVRFCMLMLASAVLMIPVSLRGQHSKQDSLWRPLEAFLGSWQGKGGGKPGIGDYERTYRFVLNKRFIEVRNKSVYSPTEKNPAGEVHEDWGFISYDRMRKMFVLRQFHIEGFVNQYTLTSISPDGKRLVFESEAIENIPRGWRARETYELHDDGTLRETFELAAPGKEFEEYSHVLLKRRD